MGGLWRNMPVTTLTFIIGGMSLAGFPLLTAGFWSKDEIFADAFHAMNENPLAVVVLVALALAAFLTALYTFRQIAMTFWGEPRTEAARYAQHNDGTTEGRNISVQITLPLIVLAFFAIVAGFVGVNPGFPLFGLLSGGRDATPFANWVGRTLLEAPPPLEFSIWPVLISFTVFGLGAWAGYVLYFRKPIVMTAPDPVEGIVGADVYRVLQNKYYIDEFYARTFINPMRWVAERLVSQIMDKGIIDGALHLVGRAAIWIGELFREFNRVVIDGVGDGIPEMIVSGARDLRRMQSGHIQQYLLYALIAAIWVTINLALIVVRPDLVGIGALIQAIAAVVLLFAFWGTGTTRPSSE